LKAIAILKEHGIHGVGVIGAYHVKRLAPLMAHALSMYQMTPQSSPDGTVMLAEDALSVGEVELRLKEAMEVPAASSGEIVPIYPIPGHLPMRPNTGFVEFVSPPSFFGCCSDFIPCQLSNPTA
jgi:hypothetical protein